jgi:integrase
MAKKLPKIISQEEFEKLFEAAERKYKNASKKRKPVFKQYMLAMLLGFEAGLRISEIVGIKKLKSRCCNEDIVEEGEK